MITAFVEGSRVLRGHIELQEMLLDLLSPGEALQVGPEVYQQHARRARTKEFFRKLRKTHDRQVCVLTMFRKL